MKDHGELIKRVHELLQDPNCGFTRYPFDDSRLPGDFALQKETSGKRDVSLVLAEETALELGAPAHRSANVFLWTRKDTPIEEGIWLAGEDAFDNGAPSMPFAQCILLKLSRNAGPADARLQNLRNLTHMLPGYMTRVLPGIIRVRIHKNRLASGFSPVCLGNCLAAAYTRLYPEVLSLAVVLVLDDSDLVGRFEGIQNLARIISGENRKLQFEADGVLSCDDLNCGSCEEKVYCDTLREVIIKRGGRS